MTSRTRDAVSLKGLETLYQVGAIGTLTDGQLLEWFVAGRGAGEAAEAGFTALVDRHGPMVLRVCRQVLGDTHDAEDAFQATFLILVRKAGSVRKRDSVASWLHGIARRVARRARVRPVPAARVRTAECGDVGQDRVPIRGRARMLARAARGGRAAAGEVPRPVGALLPRGIDHRRGVATARLPAGHDPLAAVPGTRSRCAIG